MYLGVHVRLQRDLNPVAIEHDRIIISEDRDSTFLESLVSAYESTERHNPEQHRHINLE
jgi:hypothetical protein